MTLTPAKPEKDREMIEPTVGRIVYYKPYPKEMPVGPMSGFDESPHDARCAAIITCVHSPHCVNLAVFDANGVHHAKASVSLSQPDDDCERQSHGFCEWMPYQIKKPTGSESGEPSAGTQTI